MRIDFAFLCDYAQGGPKINALGIGFDVIVAPQVPFRHSHFSLVTQLRASIVEVGQKEVDIHVIDEDGRDLIPSLKTQINVPKPKTGVESITRIVMELANVNFPQYGFYSVRAAIDGMEMINLSFRIAPPQPKPDSLDQTKTDLIL